MAMTKAQKSAFVARMQRAREGRRAANPTTEIIVAPQSTPARARGVTYLAPPPPAPKKSLAKRAGSAAVVVAVQEKELVTTLLTAGAIGYLDQEGWLQDLPEPESVPIGKKGVLALLAYGTAKWVIKDPDLKKIVMGVAQASGTIATYELVKAWTAAKQMKGLIEGGAAGDEDNAEEAGV